MFTSAQLIVIRDDILAQPDLNVFPDNSDGDFEIAKLYNLTANPNYYVYKNRVPPLEYRDGMDYTDIQGMNSQKIQTWDWLTGNMTQELDASKVKTRAAMLEAFPVNTNTYPLMISVFARLATRIERLLAPGTGNGAAAATADTLVWYGPISYHDVRNARES